MKGKEFPEPEVYCLCFISGKEFPICEVLQLGLFMGWVGITTSDVGKEEKRGD